MDIYNCNLTILPNLEGIQKNGKFKYYLNYKDKLINNYECLLLNKIRFMENTNISIDNTKYEKKLSGFYDLDFEYLKRYFVIGYKLSKKKYKLLYFEGLYIFKLKDLNLLTKYSYVKNFLYDPNSLELTKKMAYVYYLLKIKHKKISDNIIFTNLFFAFYVQSLREELKEKYGKDIAVDFENFNKLYEFLNKKKYVKKFYDVETKNIIKEYNNIKKLLIKDKEKVNKLKKMLEERMEDFKFNIDYKKLPFNKNKINIIKKEMDILMKKNKK